MKVTILGDEDADAAAMLRGYLPHPTYAAISAVTVEKAGEHYTAHFLFDNTVSFTTTLDAQCRFAGEEASGTLPEHSRPVHYQAAVAALVLRAQEREGVR